MKKQPRNIAEKRRRTIVAEVVAGKPTTEIAASLKIDRTTVWRELQTPEAKSLLENLRAALALQAHDEIVALWKTSIEKLQQLIANCQSADEFEKLQKRMFELLQQIQPAIAAADQALTRTGGNAVVFEDLMFALAQRKRIETDTPQ